MSYLPATNAARALFDDASAADLRTTLGLGALDAVTFAEVSGGSGTGSTLVLKSTTGVGATDRIQLLMGDDGAETAAQFVNSASARGLATFNASVSDAPGGFGLTLNFNRTNAVTTGGIFSALAVVFTDTGTVNGLSNQGLRFSYAKNGTGTSTAGDFTCVLSNTINETSTAQCGLNIQVSVASGKTLSTFQGVLLNNPSGAGTVTNAYGFLASSNLRNGFGTVTPSARVEIGAGSTTVPPLRLTSGTNNTSALAGAIEYDGAVIYGTTVASTRGVIPTVLLTSNVSNVTGSDVNTAQPIFNSAADTLTVPAATSYMFEALYLVTRAAGTTSHTTGVLFGGTATFTSIAYLAHATTSTGAPTATTAPTQMYSTVASNTTVVTTSTSGTEHITIHLRGIMRINASGTIIPQLQYSAAPGGAPTFLANSYFKMYPIGDNTVAAVGNWA